GAEAHRVHRGAAANSEREDRPPGAEGHDERERSRPVKIDPSVLDLDPRKTVEEIAAKLRETVLETLNRRGVVVGLSGGIDSSVTAGLAVRAFGKDRVLGLLMPERDSAEETLGLSRSVAAALGIETVHGDITPILAASRCYERRD